MLRHSQLSQPLRARLCCWHHHSHPACLDAPERVPAAAECRVRRRRIPHKSCAHACLPQRYRCHSQRQPVAPASNVYKHIDGSRLPHALQHVAAEGKAFAPTFSIGGLECYDAQGLLWRLTVSLRRCDPAIMDTSWHLQLGSSCEPYRLNVSLDRKQQVVGQHVQDAPTCMNCLVTRVASPAKRMQRAQHTCGRGTSRFASWREVLSDSDALVLTNSHHTAPLCTDSATFTPPLRACHEPNRKMQSNLCT